ncbi:hypothetical protein C4D60_Mb06t20120 [Musa balbisiana]|uniref:Uncharacterized protein n=1 Tax=Musa balbisiana TaxID=52838 RepID=A0A4S8IQ25_MUSBA|nr:hypothetical protein C4D60_Mb06t20120 [Musa balbisiana]
MINILVIVLGYGVEVKLGSLFGFTVDRHVRGTPRTTRIHHRDEHVEKAFRAPGDCHRPGRRRALFPFGHHHPFDRGGGGDRRGERLWGVTGAASSGGPLLAPGALESVLHLLEGAHALVPRGRRGCLHFREVCGGGWRRELEVEFVVSPGRWIRVALQELIGR